MFSLFRSGGLSRDGIILFAGRIVRLYACGFLSVILALYLAQMGFGAAAIGGLFTLTLLGDSRASRTILHFPNGRAHTAILYHGRGGA